MCWRGVPKDVRPPNQLVRYPASITIQWIHSESCRALVLLRRRHGVQPGTGTAAAHRGARRGIETIIHYTNWVLGALQQRCGRRSGGSGAHACWPTAVRLSTPHTRSPALYQLPQLSGRNAAGGSQGPFRRRQARQEARRRKRRGDRLAARHCHGPHGPHLRGDQPVHQAARGGATIRHRRCRQRCAQSRCSALVA